MFVRNFDGKYWDFAVSRHVPGTHPASILLGGNYGVVVGEKSGKDDISPGMSGSLPHSSIPASSLLGENKGNNTGTPD